MGFWPGPKDLYSFIHKDWAEIEDPSADLALELAIGAVRDHLHQQLEKVEDDVVTFDRDCLWHGPLLLPELPIVSVASVVSDGVTLDAGDYRIDHKVGGIVRSARGSRWGRTVVVIYTHGLEECPSTVKLVVLRAAQRLFENPAGKLTEGNDGKYSASYSRTMSDDAEVPILSSGEEEMLSPFWLPR